MKSNTSDIQAEYWSGRFDDLGALWGDEPSYSGTVLLTALKALHGNSLQARKVLTAGAGYARDELYLASNGYKVTGYDVSESGIILGRKFAQEAGRESDVTLISEDFSQATLDQEQFDGFLSHRTLHLLGPDQIDGFINNIDRAVKPGAPVVISVRNEDDFDENTMRWVSEDKLIAEYLDPKRKGQVLKFWDVAMLKEKFSDSLDLTNGGKVFLDTQEIDATDMQRETKFTVLAAFKKSTNSEISKHSSERNTIIRDLGTAAVEKAASMLMKATESQPVNLRI